MAAVEAITNRNRLEIQYVEPMLDGKHKIWKWQQPL